MKSYFPGDDLFDELWPQCFHTSPQMHPFYQPGNIEYYKAFYLGEGGKEFIDRSFVIADENGVSAGIRMYSFVNPQGKRELSCFGMIPLWFFEVLDESPKRRKKTRAVVEAVLEKICAEDHIERIWFEDPLSGQQLSYLSKILLNRGAKAEPVIRQIVDLNASEEQILRNVRKSYKSLINWGKGHLKLTVIAGDQVSDQKMEDFRQLHIQVAGRETRSQETWQVQEKMIRNNEAFAVFGVLDGELVTAALFPLSPQYCIYGVSASNRDQFDNPLSHAVIWEAILHARKVGCQFFELGLIHFPNISDIPPTPKEMSISMFKHGFGGRSEPRLSVVWEAKNN